MALPSKDFIITLIKQIDLHIGSTKRILITKKEAGYKVKRETDCFFYLTNVGTMPRRS
jgi:hypothetical protein